MPITLNYTDISTCEATTNWSVTGGGASLGTSSEVVSRQGTNYVTFKNSTAANSGVRVAYATTFDLRTNLLTAWLLQINGDRNGNNLFTPGAATAGQIKLRVYSSQSGAERWADYYQGQHIDLTQSWKGGWLLLRCSGDAGSEDANSGTWTSADAAAINAVGILLSQNLANTNNNDKPHGVDWVKYQDKIIVEDYNGGTTPWELADIYTADITKATGGGIWGVVENTENFYSFTVGIDFGDGTVGAFLAENEYIFLSHAAASFDCDVVIKANFVATFGTKNAAGTIGTYAENGVQLVVSAGPIYGTGTPSPDFTVESGGVFNNYAGLLRGFNVINLGSGGSGVIDLIGTDFFDNVDTEFRSTGVAALNIRLHFPDGSEAPIGSLDAVPNSFEGIDVFQVTDGLAVNVTATIDRYKAGDATADIVIADAQTVTLVNSTFDETKLKAV